PLVGGLGNDAEPQTLEDRRVAGLGNRVERKGPDPGAASDRRQPADQAPGHSLAPEIGMHAQPHEVESIVLALVAHRGDDPLATTGDQTVRRPWMVRRCGWRLD